MTIMTPIEIEQAIDRIRVSVARHRWDDVPGETVAEAISRRQAFQAADVAMWEAYREIQGFVASGGKTK